MQYYKTQSLYIYNVRSNYGLNKFKNKNTYFNCRTYQSKCCATEEWAVSWLWYICWEDQFMILLCIRYWTVNILTSFSPGVPFNSRSINVRLSPSLLALLNTQQQQSLIHPCHLLRLSSLMTDAFVKSLSKQLQLSLF